MDRRTKILAGLFGLVMVYVMFDRAVYPVWVKPLLTIDDRIADKREELAKLEDVEDRVKQAKHRYKAWAERAGSFDDGKIETSARAKLTELIDRHGLADRRVSTTGRAKDKKTGISRMTITVKATGTLQQAVGFLKEVRTLPHLARVGNVKLSPLSSRGAKGRPGQETMNLTVPLEVWVLPQQRIIGPIKEEDLTQPDTFVRHEDRDYSSIWKATPFSEWVPPVKLVARAGGAVNVQPGARAMLRGTVRGGLKPYKIQWSPSEGLSASDQLTPTVDTKTVLSRVYTLTVTDEMGSTSTDRVSVNVKRPPAIVQATPKAPKLRPVVPKDTGPKRWKDGRRRQIRSVLISSSAVGGVNELMLYHAKPRTTEYFAVGAEFDGGELVFVHPTGAVVRRKGGASKPPAYAIYPIGAMCDEDISDADARASGYPQLAFAAARFREADEIAAEAAAQEAAKAKADVNAVEGGAGAGDTAPSKAIGAAQPATPGRQAATGAVKQPVERSDGGALNPGAGSPKPAEVRPRAKVSAQEAFRLRQYQRQKRGRRPPA